MEGSCINAKTMQINEEIRDASVRLVGEDGEQLGILSAKDAQKMAIQRGLDLVKIAPQATPPVCKLMDYSKYCFEQAKKAKEQRKSQKTISVKEVQLTVKIADHDLNTKLNHALRFLKDGDKVKVALRFKSREILHPEWGTELMARFAQGCEEIGVIEKPAKLDGRNMIMFLAPKASK
ncbi:MAG: translation initiation factor IF-3 [Clostridia bacterium]|nr:translation initiation factor IF-3 [Clostridia bacterium]MBQ6172094.1 translation initiation factor IF-3 [Clostridia bacterium]